MKSGRVDIDSKAVDHSSFRNPNQSAHNWLVFKIHDRALREYLQHYASGILVDIGCGEKPYAAMTREFVSQHIGVDHLNTEHARNHIDVFGSAYDTTLDNAFADTILCTVVLEHLERPQDAIREMHRILKPGGCVILSAPLFWHLHEEPRDFFRYTSYGLEYLFDAAGFEVVEMRALSGFVVTFGQELCYFLTRFQRWPLRLLVRVVQFTIQRIAYLLNRWDRSDRFSWAHLLVARKPKVD